MFWKNYEKLIRGLLKKKNEQKTQQRSYKDQSPNVQS